LPVGRGNMNLIVTYHQVSFYVPAGAVHAVEQVLDTWKRLTILDSYGIYCALLYGHRQRNPRLCQEYYW
jgi:hypothetical protein